MRVQERKNRGRLQRRKNRVRAKVFGTMERPRLSFSRSNRHIYAQIINDTTGETIAFVSSRTMGDMKKKEKAHEIGKEIAKKAKNSGVEKVVFDRGRFSYTGLAKECADAARSAGLIF